MLKNVEFPARLIYIQKDDRNIHELYATLAILQKAMIFYQTLEDVVTGNWQELSAMND